MLGVLNAVFLLVEVSQVLEAPSFAGVLSLFDSPLILGLAVWLLATRRIRAFVVATAVALGGTLAAWAAIGFDGLRDYPSMLSHLSFVSEDVGVSVVAMIATAVSELGQAGNVPDRIIATPLERSSASSVNRTPVQTVFLAAIIGLALGFIAMFVYERA